MMDIDHIFVHLWGYPLSYVECVGAVFGVICVWLAARNHILTWATGLVNIVCLAVIFFQVNLYADMFLQVYFFGMSVYGWIRWSNTSTQTLSRDVKTLSNTQRIGNLGLILALTVTVGMCVSKLHVWMPQLFIHPASFPFLDTCIAVCSIIATFWMARRILENWLLWIIVDILCIGVYIQKNILFIALEYAVLLGFACYGMYFWWRLWKKTQTTPISP